MTTITNNKPLEGFHLLQLKHALALELKGLKHSRGSAYAYVKRHLGLKGNRQKVYNQLCDLCAEDKQRRENAT